MNRNALVFLYTVAAASCVAAAGSGPAPSGPRLAAMNREGREVFDCPLKHTSVRARAAGPVARVTVTQNFENTSPDKVEAVYVFPLPNRAAVDDMTMWVGDRVVKARIKRREEAREIYDKARQQGHVAALLDQERPNVFTQAVANIEPGAQVKIVISYVETLRYEAGSYEFGFPMVVGPRYMPAGGRVPDAARVKPPVTREGTRAGHDIRLEAEVDAGVPIESVSSPSHEIQVERPGRHSAVVRLKQQNEIPNRDFLLRYDVAGAALQDAVLAHRSRQGGFFTLLLQPPERVTAAEVTPKELVFVVDTSGSMSGFPIEKSKEVIKLALDGLHPRDTFNLITFAGDTHVLFPQPVPATAENVRQAQLFLLSRRGGGGTEMMKAIRAALDPSDQQDHIRIVCFLTDGYVGNDMEVVGEVKRHPNARVFAFGIGSSVNRFLLDKVAEEGRGDVEYVGLNDDGSSAARRFHERVRDPLLTDLAIDWNGAPVSEVYPARQPDLFAAKPLVVAGRYDRPFRGAIRLRGKRAGRDWSREVAVNLPGEEPAHDSLATLWAREKVEHLMSEDWLGMQRGQPRGDLREAITKVGLDFRLMTQFTSFVAVEETTVTRGGVPVKVEVPVELPHGVSRDALDERERGAPMAGRQINLGMSATISADVAVEMRKYARPERAAVGTLAAPPNAEAGRMDPRLAAATGRVSVKVWLTDDSAGVLGELKRLGLEIVEHKKGRIVVGKVDAAKLAALLALRQVLYISEDPGRP